MHADVVVTATAHIRQGRWETCGSCIACAREERRKLAEWGEQHLGHCPARMVPLAFESQGKWGARAVQELARLARLKGSLLAASPVEAQLVVQASLRRWRRWVSVALQRGNAAMVLASLGKPTPLDVDGDLLLAEPDLHDFLALP